MMRNFIGLIIVFIFFGCNKSEVLPPSAVLPTPTKHQLEWQEKELFAFIHFTVNTFTDKEWGYGDESPDIFNPVEFNPDQWAKVLKEAGFKGAILTAKHHDGFCLWPSAFTDHSVKNSNWLNGNGDVVGALKKACDEQSLEFGIYLSPWDRNHAQYGTEAYIEYYQNQLNELLGNYGTIFEIWFDGANGGDGYYGGASEMRKIDDQVYYKWNETFKIVKDFNPKTIIRGDARNALCDSRWCGNEKGYIGETNWNMIDPDTLLSLGNKRVAMLNSGTENGNVWMPAEVDVSIRPGWFYHEKEDSLIKTPDALFDIYLSSIGRGSPLLLNVAPDKRGLIPEPDVQSLLVWKKKIDEVFANNLASAAKITVDSYRGKSNQFAAANLTDGNNETYWATDDKITSGSIELDFEEPQLIKYVLLQEYIKLGQRVKSLNIEVLQNGQWEQVADATTIGYKRIVRMEPVETEKVRINITGAKACPVISNIEIY
jgi:alpha-L-fucosidase